MTYAKVNCLKLELFDHLTVCKQIVSDTWQYLYICINRIWH